MNFSGDTYVTRQISGPSIPGKATTVPTPAEGSALPAISAGEVAKAPVKDGNSVVRDVWRPERPLFRVVASGSNGKASSIRLFLVPRKSGATIWHEGKQDDVSGESFPGRPSSRVGTQSFRRSHFYLCR